MLTRAFGLVNGKIAGGGVPHVIYYLAKALSGRCTVKIAIERKTFESISFLKEGTKYDVIHSHYSTCLSHAFWRRLKRNSPPLIIHYHHYLSSKGPVSLLSRTGFTLNSADAIIVPSRLASEQLRKFYRLPSNKLKIIPNGVDVQNFKFRESGSQKLRNDLGLNNKKVVLNVGHYPAPGKGIRHLLMAAPKILKHFPDTIFILIGIPPESEREKREFLVLQQIIRDLGLADHVRFLGFVPHALLPAYYSICDVYVQASLRESFGLPFCEAMACGRPTVATRTGAAPEIIKDGVNGLLIRTSDEEAIAKAVIKILSSEELAKSLGENARKTIEEKYSWEIIAKEVLNLYNALLRM